jgi:hypothetical protein
VRLNSFTPNRFSSAAIARVTAGGDMPKRRDPAAKLSVSATATNTVIKCNRSIDCSALRKSELPRMGILQSRAIKHSAVVGDAQFTNP